MTYDEALEDTETCTLTTARRVMGQHFSRVLQASADERRIEVTNDCDDPEWIDCTPAAICAWLGY